MSDRLFLNNLKRRWFIVWKPVLSFGVIVLSAVGGLFNYFIMPITSIDEWVKSPISQEERIERALNYDPNATAQAKEEITKLRQTNLNSAMDLRNVETQKVVLIGQLDESKRQLAVLLEENQTLARSLGSIESELGSLRKQNNSLADQVTGTRRQLEIAKSQLALTQTELASITAVRKDEHGFVLNKKGARICHIVSVAQPVASSSSTSCGGSICSSTMGSYFPGVSTEECYMGEGVWAVPPG